MPSRTKIEPFSPECSLIPLREKFSALPDRAADEQGTTGPGRGDLSPGAGVGARELRGQVVQLPAEDSGGAVAVRELTLMGPDRTGIVHELTRALNTAGFNVQSLETTVETAPMSGEPLFRANARIELLEGARLDELEWQLDALAEAMTLEIDLLP